MRKIRHIMLIVCLIASLTASLTGACFAAEIPSGSDSGKLTITVDIPYTHRLTVLAEHAKASYEGKEGTVFDVPRVTGFELDITAEEGYEIQGIFLNGEDVTARYESRSKRAGSAGGPTSACSPSAGGPTSAGSPSAGGPTSTGSPSAGGPSNSGLGSNLPGDFGLRPLNSGLGDSGVLRLDSIHKDSELKIVTKASSGGGNEPGGEDPDNPGGSGSGSGSGGSGSGSGGSGGGGSGSGNEPPKPGAPKTGEQNSLILWVGVMFLAAAGTYKASTDRKQG